ncbi:MAG: ABC transporter substrate-binding protein, partial [Candidatus Bipolaricaulota bacterium]
MSKSISRRKFLKRAAYAGGSLALFSTGLFGSKATAQEDLTGTVVVDSPTTIIPGMLADAPGQNIADAMYERLFMLEGHGDGGERTPWLVEDYDRTTDGKKWTFKLKEGVKFHHGSEMTADDVVFTFNRLMDPDFGSPQKSLFSAVDDVKKKDRYTVVFELDRPVADFQLKFFAYNTVILAED